MVGVWLKWCRDTCTLHASMPFPSSLSLLPTPFPSITHTRRHIPITSIAAGHKHLLLVTADGVLLAAGSNAQGQLGLPGTYVYGKDPFDSPYTNIHWLTATPLSRARMHIYLPNLFGHTGDVTLEEPREVPFFLHLQVWSFTYVCVYVYDL